MKAEYQIFKDELTELRKERDALRERLRLSASLDEAQKIALIRALQECASVLGLDHPSPAVLVESVTALHARAEKAERRICEVVEVVDEHEHDAHFLLDLEHVLGSFGRWRKID